MKNALYGGLIVAAIAIAWTARPNRSTAPPVETTASVVMKIPHGDALAGHQAFLDLRCNACHMVDADDAKRPVASPAVPVVLGGIQAKQSKAQLVQSILAPSCEIVPGVPDVSSGSLSRMGDYRSAMTVAQLLDLVEYIQSLDIPNRQLTSEAPQAG